MFIKSIDINGFGKLSDEKIEFSNGINIVYGPNESGKSTLQGFIFNMLFGMTRNKGKAAKTDDFARYTPKLNSGIYKGSMTFEANGKEYSLIRDFNSQGHRDELIVSKDRRQVELTENSAAQIIDGLNKEAYENTSMISQEHKLNNEYIKDAMQDMYIRLASNGGENPAVSKTLKELESRRKALESESRRIQKKTDERLDRLSEKISMISSEISEKEQKLKELGIADKPKEIYEAEYDENFENEDESDDGCIGPGVLTQIIIVLTAALMFVAAYTFANARLYLITAGFGCLFVFAGTILYKSRKKKKSYNNISNKAHDAAEEDIRAIKAGYIKDGINEKKAQLEELKMEYVSEAESKAGANGNTEKIEALKLAESRIRNIAGQLNIRYDRKFKDKVEYNYLYLSGQDDAKLLFDENNEISILKDNKTIAFWQCSKGTQDLLQLSVRLAAADFIINKERLPILLDDTFVNFDEDRLKRALMLLANKKEQVIIFTCHRREEMLLDELSVNCRNIKWSGNTDI